VCKPQDLNTCMVLYKGCGIKMIRRYWKVPEEKKHVCRVCKEEKEIPQKFIEHGDYICHDCILKYRQRHRKENLIRIKEVQKEGYKRNRIARLEGRKKYLDGLRVKCATLIGDKCIICSSDGSKRKLNYHEIHGKKHPLRGSYILKHYKDFVTLCYIHHKLLHSYTQVIRDKNLEKLRELSLLIN